MWWRPQQPPLALREPELWHTTLLRCQPSIPVGLFFQQHGARLNALGQMVLRALTFQRNANNTITVNLGLPPWARSWTFGVPQEVSHALMPLCEMMRQSILAVDGGADIAFDADDANGFHISWK